MHASPDHPSGRDLFADIARFVRHGDTEAGDLIAQSTGAPLGRTLAGLQIHASTTHQTLTRALADAVPSVAATLSEDTFASIARGFIAMHPPRLAALHQWGGELPGFLARHNADPYLTDWAQLDRAWLASLFAADAQSIDAERLVQLPPGDVLRTRLQTHPSLQLVRLDGPWFGPWLDLGAVSHVVGTPPDKDAESHVMFVRPEAKVHAVAVMPAVYAFVEALHGRQVLEAACEAALTIDPAFDLQATLVRLFAGGYFIDVTPESQTHDDE